MYINFIYSTLCSLVYIDNYVFASRKEQKLYWKYIKKCEKELKQSNDIYPVNFAHLYLLVQAEKAKLKNNFMEAISYYDQAIEHAKTNQFTNFVAIINERAGNYCLKTSRKFAKSYLQEAHYYYTLWGATAKAKQLEKQFSQLFQEEDRVSSSSGIITITNSFTSKTSDLDFLSVIKASQSISGEVILKKLFEKMLHVTIENAGAQKAIFIEHLKDEWRVSATLLHQTDREQFNIEHTPLLQFEDLPQAIVQFSLRSKEPLIVDNPKDDSIFAADSYVNRIAPKSTLCLPIVHQGTIVAVIYLENNTTAGAFNTIGP